MISHSSLIKCAEKSINELIALFETGERHCSFVIPVKSGKTNIAYTVGKELSYRFDVVYVFSSSLICNSFKESYYFNENTSFVVVDSKNRIFKTPDHSKPYLFVMIDCSVSDLLFLQNVLSKHRTLSFSSEKNMLAKDPSSPLILSSVKAKDDLVPSAIVCTKVAIDYCLASLYEDINQLKITTSDTYRPYKPLRENDAHVYNHKEEIMYCKLARSLEDDGSLRIKEAPKNAKKKFSTKNKRKEIAYEIIDKVFKHMGIPTDETLDFIAKMKDIKANSCESGEEDEYAKQIQEMTYSALFECFAKQFDSSVVADKCAYDFGEKTWKTLLPDAKKAIVSGIATFNFMSFTPSKEYYDYSGVCMLISKAVELELELYLHANYIKYLQSIFGDDLSKYPKPLVFTKNGQNSLGYFSLEHASRIVKYNVGGVEKYDDVFLDYAKKHLYKRASDETIKANIDEICNFAETVRISYRNRAAHKDKLDYDTMDNCLQYVVYVQKMLKVVVDKFSPITL